MEMKTTNYLQGIKINYSLCRLENNYILLGTSFEIQADIFMSLESIWRAFGRVKYRKTSKGIYILFYDKSMVY